MIWTLIYLLFLHWVADFVCQTNWMALNKSKCNKALTAHIATYSLVMLFGLCLWSAFYPLGWGALWLTLINGVLHWGTDYVTSRITGYFWGINRRDLFFMTIGFDQFIHGATLLLLANYFLVS